MKISSCIDLGRSLRQVYGDNPGRAVQVEQQVEQDRARQTATTEAILKRFVSTNERERRELVLLADEVGLGKTYVALAVAVFRMFDFNDIGAKVGEQHRREWRRHHIAGVDHAHAFKRFVFALFGQRKIVVFFNVISHCLRCPSFSPGILRIKNSGNKPDAFDDAIPPGLYRNQQIYRWRNRQWQNPQR